MSDLGQPQVQIAMEEWCLFSTALTIHWASDSCFNFELINPFRKRHKRGGLQFKFAMSLALGYISLLNLLSFISALIKFLAGYFCILLGELPFFLSIFRLFSNFIQVCNIFSFWFIAEIYVVLTSICK